MKDNKKIIFLCIAGKKYGLGHVQRSLKIARKICTKDKNIKINFITIAENSKEIIKKRIMPFALRFVPDKKTEISKAINELNPNLLIIDRLSFDSSFFKKRNYKIITLDNDSKGADVYINILKYHSFKNNKKEFNGYQYWAIEKPRKRKSVKTLGKIKRILISCGYTDPSRLTLKITKNLINYYSCYSTKIKFIPKITCVITKAYSSDIEEKLRKVKNNIVILKDLKNLNKEILNTDLCIVTGGNTLFESVASAVPTLVIPYGNANDQISNILEKKGFVIKTKIDCPDKEFYTIFESLSANNLRKLCKQCKKFDGFGMKKIVKIIFKNLYNTKIKNEG